MKSRITLFLVAIFSVLSSLKIDAQEIEIDLTFTQDTVIYPFGSIDTISELSMSGNLILNQDTSLVRVIIEDTSGMQYLIFEAYPLICADTSFTFSHHCDETCFLDQVNPYSVIIQIIDASLDLSSLYYSSDTKENCIEERYKAKRAMDAEKIEIMNDQILFHGMNWVAGDNSEVAEFYNQKRQINGDGYNLLGYEYYSGGVFEFLGHRNYPRVNPDLVRSFDWRSRHGANDPLSPYWDGDPHKTGWLTRAKYQGFQCQSCWSFSSVGVTEALCNLYTAQHKDFILSEQDLLSCSLAGDCYFGGSVDSALSYIRFYGIVNEDCFPYLAQDYTEIPCTTDLKCQNPEHLISIENFSNYIYSSNFTEDSLRIKLITKGPVTIDYEIGELKYHSAVLTGFEFDPYDSTLFWIIKNSKDTTWGDKGFGRMKLEKFVSANSISLPVYDKSQILLTNCRDADSDGYCFWGLGPRPENCPSFCDTIADCDDSNPLVGGYDENYNCTCLVEFNSIPIHISADTTWSDSLIVQNPIIIDSGVCLTITAVIQFHPDVKITVDKGGKLVLDGGKLTNACPDLWEGIDVLGSDTAQYFSQYFGVLEIKDGGTIENARVAVSNYCKACEYQDAGGIINADDGIFRNNQVAFEFAPFDNIYQGTERLYLGSFERCRFIYDEFLQDYGDFRYFIKLNQVNGIKINGCEFTCDTISIDESKERSLKYKTGIYSIGSHFSVDVACAEDILPCPGYVPCVFHGLNYGIYALGITGAEVISIKKSNFISNRTGIYLSGENYATIVQDTFKVYAEKKSMDTICGLYLDYCTGYQVEENDFLGDYFYQLWQSQSKCVGIVVNNSGEEYNEIYNNRFDSLYVGTQAQNVNRDEKKGNGLQILCNDYTHGYYDIAVTADNSSGNDGIAYNQGSDGLDRTSTANNTFSLSKPTNNNDFSDYFNECKDLIYWHLLDTISAPIKPKYYSIPEVNLQYNFNNNHLYEKDSCCPSSFSQGVGGSLHETKLLMAEFIQKADSVKSQIEYFEDGGDTYNLRNDVQTSLPEDAEELADALMSFSPYLSDSVMVASVEKETVITSAMITGILSENPQAAKSDTVQVTLDNRINQLTEEQRSLIDQGWFTTGEIEKMKSTFTYYDRKKANAFYTLARAFKDNTSMVYTFDSLTLLYQEYPSLQSKYDLVFEYAEQGDSLNAFSALYSIPGNYYLDIEEFEFHQQAEQFLQILNTYLINNIYNDLDSIQMENLYSLSLIGEGQIKALARNILLANNYSNYKEPIIFPQQSSKSERIRRIPLKMDASLPSILVYPNPANSHVHIEIINNEYYSGGVLNIFEITGRLVFSITINKWQKSIDINSDELKQGSFLLVYKDNTGYIQFQKLIISN